MKNSDDNSFVFGDIPEEASFHKNEVGNQKIEKLSNRLTFISIIIPVLIFVIIGFAYFDIKNSVVKVSDSGTKEVKNISTDVERLVSSIKIQNAKFEKKIEEQLKTIEKKLFDAQKDINYLSSIKINKKAIEPEISKLQNAVAGVTGGLDEIKRNVASQKNELEKTINSRLTEISADTESKIFKTESTLKDMMEKRFDTMDKQVAKQSDIDTAIKKQRIIYQVKLDQLNSEFDKKIKMIKFGTPNSSSKVNSKPSSSDIAKNSTGSVIEKDL
jgi:hypothetical protein